MASASGDWEFDELFSSSPGAARKEISLPIQDNDADLDAEDTNYSFPDEEGDVPEGATFDPAASKVTMEDFEVIKLVGKGGFGKVFQVVEKATETVYAMKVLSKSFLIDTNNVEYTKAERYVLTKVRHPNIVSMKYAFQTGEKVCLVMDYASGGQLFFHLRNEAMFSEKVVRFYIAEIVLALEHLHGLGIVHRDLKPENLLLDQDGHVLLTDFGFAKEVGDQDAAKSFCGTLEYMAPEAIEGKPYGKAADWWSVGVLMYDMLTGSPPFVSKNRGALQQKILKQKPKLPSYLSGEACSLIRQFMNRDPQQRLGSGKDGMKQIKAHSFFRGVVWKRFVTGEEPVPFRPKVEKGQLDNANFDEVSTSPDGLDGVPGELSASQDALFKGFSFIRSPCLLASQLNSPPQGGSPPC